MNSVRRPELASDTSTCIHAGGSWPFAQPGMQAGQLIASSLGQNLHAAVVIVAHPSGDAQMCASRSTNQRKPTPCTRPRTMKRRAWIGFSVESSLQDSRVAGSYIVRFAPNPGFECVSGLHVCAGADAFVRLERRASDAC